LTDIMLHAAGKITWSCCETSHEIPRWP